MNNIKYINPKEILRIDDKNECHGMRLNLIWFGLVNKTRSEHWVKVRNKLKCLAKEPWKVYKSTWNVDVLNWMHDGINEYFEHGKFINLFFCCNKSLTIFVNKFNNRQQDQTFHWWKFCYLVWSVMRRTSWKKLKGLLKLEI
jgi:hypothetical protein